MKESICFFVAGILLLMLPGCAVRVVEMGENPSVTSTPLDAKITLDVISTPVSPIGDGGLISGQPCYAPCFWGIEPGKTDMDEVQDILNHKGVMDMCTYLDEAGEDEEYIQSRWLCRWGEITQVSFVQERLLIEFSNTGVVKTVLFDLSSPISLKSVVERYGPPMGVMVTDFGLPNMPALRSEILYNDVHMILLLRGEQENMVYAITEDTMVDVVLYMDESSFRRYLQEWQYIIWDGYGEYKAPYPP